jgi:hypothetical protein
MHGILYDDMDIDIDASQHLIRFYKQPPAPLPPLANYREIRFLAVRIPQLSWARNRFFACGYGVIKTRPETWQWRQTQTRWLDVRMSNVVAPVVVVASGDAGRVI